jgi:hypothetical protein
MHQILDEFTGDHLSMFCYFYPPSETSTKTGVRINRMQSGVGVSCDCREICYRTPIEVDDIQTYTTATQTRNKKYYY